MTDYTTRLVLEAAEHLSKTSTQAKLPKVVSKYIHLGQGVYKQKGREKDPNAKTFEKDDNGKFVEIKPEKGKLKEPPKSDPAAKATVPPAAASKDNKTTDTKAKNYSVPSASAPVSDKDSPKVSSNKVAKLMPKANKDTFNDKSDIPGKISTKDRKKISMKIDKLAEIAKQAKEKGDKAPNFNLCKITVPGTNLYCQDNAGIPRDQMPQFKGKPNPGSPASKMHANVSGEVDTEPMFKEMLEKKGIKSVQTEIPSDSLKATQSELVGSKVAGMTKALEENPNHSAITAPIYVSRDGYVIDGHHRWAAVTSAAVIAGKPANMKVIVIDMDVKDAIPLANKFAEDIGIAAKKADANQEGPAAQKYIVNAVDAEDKKRKFRVSAESDRDAETKLKKSYPSLEIVSTKKNIGEETHPSINSCKTCNITDSESNMEEGTQWKISPNKDAIIRIYGSLPPENPKATDEVHPYHLGGYSDLYKTVNNFRPRSNLPKTYAQLDNEVKALLNAYASEKESTTKARITRKLSKAQERQAAMKLIKTNKHNTELGDALKRALGEEVEAFDEQENLDELSKGTLSRYMRKGADQVRMDRAASNFHRNKAARPGVGARDSKLTTSKQTHIKLAHNYDKRTGKRIKGMAAASKRIVGETMKEDSQLDEIKVDTDKYYALFGGKVHGPYDNKSEASRDTKGDAKWIKKGSEMGKNRPASMRSRNEETIQTESNNVIESATSAPPFAKPYKKTKKSGAEHSPMSRARYLARKAIAKKMKMQEGSLKDLLDPFARRASNTGTPPSTSELIKFHQDELASLGPNASKSSRVYHERWIRKLERLAGPASRRARPARKMREEVSMDEGLQRRGKKSTGSGYKQWSPAEPVLAIMKNRKCVNCKKGTYGYQTPQDEWQGNLNCTKCRHNVEYEVELEKKGNKSTFKDRGGFTHQFKEEVEVTEAFPPRKPGMQGTALVVNGKVVARGSAKSLRRIAKTDHGGLAQGKVFITHTGKEVGDTWKEETQLGEGSRISAKAARDLLTSLGQPHAHLDDLVLTRDPRMREFDYDNDRLNVLRNDLQKLDDVKFKRRYRKNKSAYSWAQKGKKYFSESDSEQLDELKTDTMGSYVNKRKSQLSSFKYSKPFHSPMASGRVQGNAVDGIKRAERLAKRNKDARQDIFHSKAALTKYHTKTRNEEMTTQEETQIDEYRDAQWRADTKSAVDNNNERIYKKLLKTNPEKAEKWSKYMEKLSKKKSVKEGNLDEISPKKLGDYIDGAGRDAQALSAVGNHYGFTSPRGKWAAAKATKRLAGINKATKKLPAAAHKKGPQPGSKLKKEENEPSGNVSKYQDRKAKNKHDTSEWEGRETTKYQLVINGKPWDKKFEKEISAKKAALSMADKNPKLRGKIKIQKAYGYTKESIETLDETKKISARENIIIRHLGKSPADVARIRRAIMQGDKAMQNPQLRQEILNMFNALMGLAVNDPTVHARAKKAFSAEKAASAKEIGEQSDLISRTLICIEEGRGYGPNIMSPLSAFKGRNPNGPWSITNPKTGRPMHWSRTEITKKSPVYKDVKDILKRMGIKENPIINKDGKPIQEEVETLSEISKKVLGRYINKATGDVEAKSKTAGFHDFRAKNPGRWDNPADADDKWYTNIVKHHKGVAAKFKGKVDKRKAGIGKAVDRLTSKKKLGETIDDQVKELFRQTDWGSIDEGKMNQLSVDLKDMSDRAFKLKYKKTKEEMKRSLNVKESKADSWSPEKQFAGWIATFQGKTFEIIKSSKPGPASANDLLGAKVKAGAYFKVPKSKQGLLSVKPGYVSYYAQATRPDSYLPNYTPGPRTGPRKLV